MICSTNETKLKAEFMKYAVPAMPGYELIRLEDKFRHGIPDLTVTGFGWTSWWEFKYANPKCKKDGDQEYMLRKLDQKGYARYVIFVEGEQRTTHIVRPLHYKEWMTTTMKLTVAEFSFAALCQHIHKVHNDFRGA